MTRTWGHCRDVRATRIVSPNEIFLLNIWLSKGLLFGIHSRLRPKRLGEDKRSHSSSWLSASSSKILFLTCFLQKKTYFPHLKVPKKSFQKSVNSMSLCFFFVSQFFVRSFNIPPCNSNTKSQKYNWEAKIKFQGR